MSRVDRFGLALALSAIAWLSGCGTPNAADAERVLGAGASCQPITGGAVWACAHHGRAYLCIADRDDDSIACLPTACLTPAEAP